MRKLGERALITVFERLELDQAGSHELADPGGFGEPTRQSRPWRFGDPFRIDLQGHGRRTPSSARARPKGKLRLVPDDFMLAEAEARTSTSTVLLLDMSRSMPMRGHWEHARRMTFALHTLITSQFPEDRLHIVGFADYARVLRPTDLAAVEWEPIYGTNYEHAFLLAARLLSKESSGARQVILVTDGEPTAHLVGDQVFFNWPPVRETIERSLREAQRLARGGVTMNIFMLEDEPRLAHFIDRLAKLVRGRVFCRTRRRSRQLRRARLRARQRPLTLHPTQTGDSGLRLLDARALSHVRGTASTEMYQEWISSLCMSRTALPHGPRRLNGRTHAGVHHRKRDGPGMRCRITDSQGHR